MAEFEVFRHSVLSCSNRLLVLLEYQVFRYCRRYTDRHAGTAKPETRGGSNVIHSDLADEAIDARALRELATTYGERAVRLPPVALVIAAYNEEGAVGPVVESLPRTLCGLAAEVIVVADGCADATAKEAHEAGAVVADVPVNRGQGAALRLGYRIARAGGAAYIVTTDADGQYNPLEMESLLGPVVAGRADFVTGSRRLGSEETRDPVRRAGVRFFAFLVSTLTGERVSDTTFGLRAMRAEVTGAVRLSQPQYQASELLIGAIARGYRVLEVPATIHRRTVGESKKGHNLFHRLNSTAVNNLFYGARFTRVVLRTWWRERRTPRG
jgi:glycosyltransferase involved in cell wall biosynthesis